MQPLAETIRHILYPMFQQYSVQQDEKCRQTLSPHLLATTVRTSGSLCVRTRACKELQSCTESHSCLCHRSSLKCSCSISVTKAETRPTLSHSSLSGHPHVPQDTVTPLTDLQWPLSVRGSMLWGGKLVRAALISESLWGPDTQRFGKAHPHSFDLKCDP